MSLNVSPLQSTLHHDLSQTKASSLEDAFKGLSIVEQIKLSASRRIKPAESLAARQVEEEISIVKEQSLPRTIFLSIKGNGSIPASQKNFFAKPESSAKRACRKSSDEVKSCANAAINASEKTRTSGAKRKWSSGSEEE